MEKKEEKDGGGKGAITCLHKFPVAYSELGNGINSNVCIFFIILNFLNFYLQQTENIQV